jgi:hypothetical protein
MGEEERSKAASRLSCNSCQDCVTPPVTEVQSRTFSRIGSDRYQPAFPGVSIAEPFKSRLALNSETSNFPYQFQTSLGGLALNNGAITRMRGSGTNDAQFTHNNYCSQRFEERNSTLQRSARDSAKTIHMNQNGFSAPARRTTPTSPLKHWKPTKVCGNGLLHAPQCGEIRVCSSEIRTPVYSRII